MRYRDLYTKNLGLKLVALILAVVLWYTAVGRERAEVGLNVPLELTNFPPNMVVANEVPDGITVRILGSVALTRQVSDRKLRFSLDLSGAKAGSNQFKILPEALGLPRGLEVTRLSPNAVNVELEPLVTKTVSLLPVIKGEPVPGFVIEDITLSPKELEIRGPRGAVENLTVVWTEPIDITTLSKSTSIPAQLSLPDVSISPAKPTEIKAVLKIEPKIAARDFQNVAVEAVNASKPYILSPDAVFVTVRGPVNFLNDLAPGKNLTVRLNLAGLEVGTYERPVAVAVPGGMEATAVEPKIIKIEILSEKDLKQDGN